MPRKKNSFTGIHIVGVTGGDPGPAKDREAMPEAKRYRVKAHRLPTPAGRRYRDDWVWLSDDEAKPFVKAGKIAEE